jgi:hypothetical protein
MSIDLKTIYLQDETEWHCEIINGDDVEYIRADIVDELRAELSRKSEELKQMNSLLSDPAAVRLNILRGLIKIPDDLVWFYDTHGPVAELRNKIEILEKEINNVTIKTD